MIVVTQGFQKELPKLLSQISVDLSQMLDMEVEFSVEPFETGLVQDHLNSVETGNVCCRSCYIKNASGIGGLLIPARAAMVMSYGAMLMDPPGADDPFEWEGLVDEAMAEIWNVLIGSWNRVASPDYRMSTKTEERAIELYPTQVALPETSGIFPEAAKVHLKLGEEEFDIQLFLPFKAIQGGDHKGFDAQRPFEKTTVAPVASAPAGDGAAAAPAAPTGPRQNLVFIDYTGIVLRLLRTKARDGQLGFTMSKSVEETELGKEHAQPLAVVVSSDDLDFVKELENCSFVEIRRSRSLQA